MSAQVFFKKFAQYSGIGITVFILEYALYIAAVAYGMDYLVATILTFIAGITIQYGTTRRFVFSHTTRAWTTGYAMFAFGALCGVALISGVMILLVEHLGLHPLIARPIAGAFVGFLSYVFNCYETFR
jgi:putative flippase GtrA